MKVLQIVLTVMLVLSMATAATLAKESSWTLRVHGAFIETSAAGRNSLSFGTTSSISAGGGFGIGAEYRLTPRFGLEFSTLIGGLDVGVSVTGGLSTVQNLDVSMMPLTLAVPFHFNTGSRADLFVAPTFSVVRYLDIEFVAGGTGIGGSIDVDSDAALGALVGVDIPFGKGRWAFSTSLRYMKTSFDNTDLDPVIVTLGFAVRF